MDQYKLDDISVDSDDDEELVAALNNYEARQQTGGAAPYSVTFNTREGNRRRVARFNSTSINYVSSVTQVGAPRDLADATRAVREGMQQCLSNLFADFNPQDFVTFFMKSDRMASSLNLPMMRVGGCKRGRECG